MNLIKQIIFIMSILSIILACFKKKNKVDEYSNIPLFPLSTNANFSVRPFPSDTGFISQASIISEDRNEIFLLAFGLGGTVNNMNYQITKLNKDGKRIGKTILNNCHWTKEPFLFWDSSNRLNINLSDGLKIIDSEYLSLIQIHKRMDKSNFLNSKKLVLMEYHEMDDAYYQALNKTISKYNSIHVQTIQDESFLMLDNSSGNGEQWQIDSDIELQNMIAKYGEKKINLYHPLNGDKDSLVDGQTQIIPLQKIILDTHYSYSAPIVRNDENHIMEITIGKQKSKFKLTNLDKHSLKLHFACNNLLSTSNKTIWLIHDAVLYQITFKK